MPILGDLASQRKGDATGELLRAEPAGGKVPGNEDETAPKETS
jgi:hypothetical protein